MFEGNSRRQGVMQTNGKEEQAPPGAIVHCVPMEMFAVQYGRQDGRSVKTIFVHIGNQWYEAPNSESWAASLHPVQTKYAKQLDNMRAAKKDKSVPKSDSVDPMGE